MKYGKLNRKAIYCMFLGTLVSTIIGLGILIMIYIGIRVEIPSDIENVIFKVLVLIIIISVLNLFVSPIIRYNRYRYKINEEEVDVIEGLWFISRTIVPIERLHKITLQRGPIDNMFGLSKVIITTAGGDATIRFLENEKAEKIAESLKNKVNQIAKNEVK